MRSGLHSHIGSFFVFSTWTKTGMRLLLPYDFRVEDAI